MQQNTIVPVGRLFFWAHKVHGTGGSHYGETMQDDRPIAEDYHAYLNHDDAVAVFDSGNSYVTHYDYIDWTAFNNARTVNRTPRGLASAWTWNWNRG